MPSRLLSCVLLIAVAACKQDVATPPPPPPPGPVIPTPLRSADAQAASPLIELLHHTRAVVAVSSTVLNPKIQPEQLVDGNLATAWNSRTGDLAGAWIAFRVPSDAHVKQVKLTAGFVAKGREGDYFTMNQRIRSVRITSGGKLIANATLDPELRVLQTIPVDGPGGDYRIEITSLLVGTQKTWRETCVSELEVWGAAPTAFAAPSPPTVTIGSLDMLAHDPMTGPFPSIASFCEAWAKPIREANSGGRPDVSTTSRSPHLPEPSAERGSSSSTTATASTATSGACFSWEHAPAGSRRRRCSARAAKGPTCRS